ncbi:MAG: hypothetical protein J7M20_09335, partial [Deltaproteobacteria bacterium]|nr:hypothetical protein [Deltaproteobacteria bacterium]
QFVAEDEKIQFGIASSFLKRDRSILQHWSSARFPVEKSAFYLGGAVSFRNILIPKSIGAASVYVNYFNML